MAEDRKPGVRPADAVYELGIATMEDLLLQRVPWARIIALLHEGGYTQAEATLRDWRKEIRRRWAVQDAEEKPHRRDEHRELLRTLYHKSYVEADYRCCEKIARQLMILDGLHAPTQINLSGSVAVEAMTPTQREAEIAELLKRREEAKRREAAAPRGAN